MYQLWFYLGVDGADLMRKKGGPSPNIPKLHVLSLFDSDLMGGITNIVYKP
jgi:hypothetical protein